MSIMISYQREKDAILYITDQYKKNPAITIITHRNFGRIDNFSTFITAAPAIGYWHPQLTVGIQKQWAKVEHNGRWQPNLQQTDEYRCIQHL